jgi:hypothetical protein
MVKIDVQGAEWDVLDGAVECIRMFSPRFVLELDNQQLKMRLHGSRPAALLLSQMGYRIRRVGERASLDFDQLSAEAEQDLARGKLQTNYVFEM